MCSEKPICAPPCLSQVSTTSPLKQFQYLSDDNGPLSSFHGCCINIYTTEVLLGFEFQTAPQELGKSWFTKQCTLLPHMPALSMTSITWLIKQCTFLPHVPALSMTSITWLIKQCTFLPRMPALSMTSIIWFTKQCTFLPHVPALSMTSILGKKTARAQSWGFVIQMYS